MNMLGRLFQLGEGGQSVAGLGIFRIVDLDEDGPISLHDKGIRWIVVHAVTHAVVPEPSPLRAAKSKMAMYWFGQGDARRSAKARMRMNYSVHADSDSSRGHF